MSAAIIPRMNRTTVLGVSLSLAIGLSACSGDSGSPTSPSASLSGGGTTISGTALAEGGATSSSQRTSLSTRTFGALDTPDDLRVCVVGADVCVGVGESGTFELNGDLEGDVELHITGRDQDVRVTVDDVRAGETVVVSIRLNGDHGSLEVESRRGGSSDHLVHVCHVTDNGDYRLLEVDESARQAHVDHGDGIPGEPVPTDTSLRFDDDCRTNGTGESEEEEEDAEDEDDEEEEDGEESNEEEGEKVALYHATGNGTYRSITVSMSAVPAHMAHGDGKPNEEVPNSAPAVVLDANCAVVEEAAPE